MHSDPESKKAEQQKNLINPYCELANKGASRVPPAIDYTLSDIEFLSDELR